MTEESNPKPNLTRAWIWTVVLLFAIFAAARFVNLTDRPMHNDEGVNGFFMNKLMTSGNYKYDPNNYHGPSLYFFQWLPSKIFGLSVFTTRATIALAGLLFLSGYLFCLSLLGPWGMLAALLLAGFSSDVLFFSRYFIHETYVLLFTFGVFLGFLRFTETRRPRPFYLAVLSIILLLCTKETGVLHLGVMGAAIFAALYLGKDFQFSAREFFSPVRRHWKWFLLLSVGVWALLFSSFFKNIPGLMDSFRAYLPWIKQGVKSGHEKVWHYYLMKILFPYEPGLVALTVVGTLAAIIKNETKGLFLVFWTFGLLGLYSAIPYKTPWLVVNFILPMSLLSGYGVQTVHTWIEQIPSMEVRRKSSAALVFIIMVALAVPIPKLLQVNYTESSDERHPQIYVHTSTDIFRLISDIKEISKKTGAGNQLLIQVVSPQYWPLPFYLKDFPQAKFWGKADVDTSLEAPLVLAASSQRTEVRNILTGSYSIRNYTLRPGYYLDLWMNNRVLEAYETPLLVPDLLKAVHPSSSLAPGLREEIFNNGFLQGKPVIVNGARKEVHFYFDSDDKKPLKPPYSIRWTGYIKIPVDGVYRFSLDSDDGSKLIIDKQALIDNSGGHPLTRKSRGANLSKGFHALELTYSELGGTAELEFYWKPPQSIELLVPSTALFTDYARQ